MKVLPNVAGQEFTEAERTSDVTTILENLVRLDELLDDDSRQRLGSVPYLELSKHLRIRPGGGE